MMAQYVSFRHSFSKIARWIFVLVFVFSVALFGAIKVYAVLMSDNVLGLPTDIDRKQSFIAHGGGLVDGISQSNTYEAVIRSIELGCNLIELDLIETADGILIASHDWGRLRGDIGHSVRRTPVPLSFMELQDAKILDKYTMLSTQGIQSLLHDQPQIYLFTDQTTNYRLVASIGYSDRLFVETFDFIDYFFALHHGIKRPMLNVNSGKLGIIVGLVGYFLVNPKHITVSVNTVQAYPWFIRMLADGGVQIFVFTVNDSYLAEKYISEYRAIIYSDYLLSNCEKS